MEGESCISNVYMWSKDLFRVRKMFYKSPITDIKALNNLFLPEDCSFMFYYTTKFNQDISSFDTSKVTNMSYMFYNAEGFKDRDLSGWDVGKATKHTDFFKDAGSGNTESGWS